MSTSWFYAYCDNWVVHSNNLTLNNYGIYAKTWTGYRVRVYVSNWLIYRNDISENVHGIYIQPYGYGGSGTGHINNWIVYRNDIARNTGHGIFGNPYTWSTSNSYANGWNIHNNIIESNGGAGIYGRGDYYFAGDPYCNDWIIHHNIITDNNYDAGIRTGWHANGWTIYSNNITRNEQGMHISSENNVLSGNRINNNTFNFGVSISYIQDVDASNTVNGKPMYYWVNKQTDHVPADAGYVALVDCANITVQNLNLSLNEHGILIVRSENVKMQKILVTNNKYGIYIQEYTGYTISGIQSVNNTYGIYLRDSANCTVTGNNITENEYGIYLSGSSNNAVYHNNFEQNAQQATTIGTVVNVWDDGYPSGGNYWSDYTGPDECKGIYQNEMSSDGIVDVSYVIDQENVDNYPLSAPWSSPINIIMPGNTTYRGTNITLTFALDFNASWISYRLDGGANTTIVGNITLSNLPHGTHYVIIYANDTSGNLYSSSKVYFTITFLTDLNYDQIVNIRDLAMTSYAYGSYPGEPRWKVVTDVNKDGEVDIKDIAQVAVDYGKAWY